MNGVRAALALLTRLPVGGAPADIRAAAGWIPLAALVFGGLAGSSTWLAWALLPPPAAGAVAVCAWVVLSGALHLDGLADTADASLAAVPRERRLEILADVHHGSYALAAVALVLVAKAAFVASAGTAAGAAAAVFAATVAARSMLPAVARAMPPLRPGGMGARFRAGCGRGASAVGLGVASLSCVAAMGWPGLAAVGGCAAAMLMSGVAIARALGGVNGDGYGAAIELGECAALLAAVALVEQGTPWAGVAWLR